MGFFGLMHKDVLVSLLSLEESVVTEMRVADDGTEHLPMGINDKRTLTAWLHARAIPATRHGIATICNDTFSFMLQNYGLSLTDCYWLKPLSDSAGWGEVNFYDNDFQTTSVLDDLGSLSAEGNRPFTPSASLKGDLEKKWIIDSSERVLLKGNSGVTALQSVAEVLASRIYKQQSGIPFVMYDFAELNTGDQDVLGCKCKNFTSKELEFVPAIDIVNSRKRKQDQSYFQLFIQLCEENGIEDAESFMSSMLSVDFLIANTDRHLNNFGILRNPDTLRWISMAPVFDSGNSLCYNYPTGSRLPDRNGLLNSPVNSFTKTIAEQLRLVRKSQLDLERLPCEDEYRTILHEDKVLSEFDVEQRISMLGDLRSVYGEFLGGTKVWKYGWGRSISSFN